MAFRRLAQENYGSPDSPVPPTTPRNRPSIVSAYRSPASTASISSSIPFDWEAARSRRPPPYGSPLQNKPRRSMAFQTPGAQPRKAVIRKKGLVDRITSIPSTIAFEIAIFPHNVPLPSPKTCANIVGGVMHLLHFCVRLSHINRTSDSELGWEDMYQEEKAWFDWTLPVSCLLIASALVNAIYLLSRTKTYHFHRQSDPLSSPNAKFVSTKLDLEPEPPVPLKRRALSGAWRAFAFFWRFLLGWKQPTSYGTESGKTTRVQELQMWDPSEFELTLFSVYSPIHPLLWMATNTSNWILMFIIMFLVSFQLNTTIRAFTILVKDKAIVAAETFHEYNSGYVYPRLHPIRKDVAVMTHQAEMVNVWED
ncbi:hypothetical protein M378DRAFT_68937 [Amanita muscaria Koide BX008]|uniref:Nuclear rim protein 1 n=1 Tax=Amanita muscaria (strain Koide BX008) TaxID=946122 RepID=A0A0C2X604_AMAMK|nr:hypothetical protein M378DRAFT_68937 [Amanita muscaria Koide BX008]